MMHYALSNAVHGAVPQPPWAVMASAGERYLAFSSLHTYRRDPVPSGGWTRAS